MNDLLSLVYDQAPQYAVVCATVIAAMYAAQALLGVVQSEASKPAFWVTWVLVVTAAAHTTLLAATVWIPHASGGVALNVGFAQALSVATCVGVWLFIIESYWLRKEGLTGLDGLRPLALSLPAAAVLLATYIAPKPTVLHSTAALHVLVAIAAHGVALLACGHAVLLLALNRVLKNGATTGWALALSQQCPPLVVLERLLLRLSIWVAVMLSVTVGLGVWGGHTRFDHKTILTLISLTAWLALAWGYKQRGWRGAKLAKAAFVATGLLLLAYIGSRFVLQTILQR